MATAIVTGATGILGREIVAELSKAPEKWKTIHALSRSKKEDFASNVVHDHIDLSASADEMAQQLSHVSGEYVFFAAYLQKDTEQENWDVNGAMLSNFLQALTKNGTTKTLEKIVLITGAKQYGVHLGQAKNPMEESDPWLRDSKWPPNFYYKQQDVLHEFCREHTHVDWVVTYPNDVIGFARGNFMNLALSIGLYAAVSAEMQRSGAEEADGLVFPGSESFYTKFDCFTSSQLQAQFCCWAALEPKASNEAFNVVNGDVESWQNLWPRVAARFGSKVKADQFVGASKVGKVTELAEKPPLTELAAKIGLEGTDAMEQSKIEARIDLSKWAEREDVKHAWDTLAKREGLVQEAFGQATWDFLNFTLGRSYDLVISMSKARRLGWTGYQDTWSALDGVFEKLEQEKILPRAKKV
jgi:nucleoside-diphosphate-sugar epimerase